MEASTKVDSILEYLGFKTPYFKRGKVYVNSLLFATDFLLRRKPRECVQITISNS